MSKRHKFLWAIGVGLVLLYTGIWAYRVYSERETARRIEHERTATGWVPVAGGYQKLTRRDVANATGGSPLYWLDNDRLLLPGRAVRREAPDPQTGAARYTEPERQNVLYIWNVATNSLRRIDDLRSDRGYMLAYCDGVVHYSTPRSREDYLDLRMGPIGAIKDVPQDGTWKEIIKRCELWPLEAKIRAKEGNKRYRYFPLRPSDGYIVAGRCFSDTSCNSPAREDANKPALYIKNDGSPPVELPLLNKQLVAWYDHPEQLFVPFADAYLLVPQAHPTNDRYTDMGAWATKEPMRAYLMKRDGSTQAIDVPPTYHRSGKYAYTRAGFVMYSTSGGLPEDLGGVLLRDGKLFKLYDYYTQAWGVSPDGCRLAYAALGRDKYTPMFPSVIDFCNKHQ